MVASVCCPLSRALRKDAVDAKILSVEYEFLGRVDNQGSGVHLSLWLCFLFNSLDIALEVGIKFSPWDGLSLVCLLPGFTPL